MAALYLFQSKDSPQERGNLKQICPLSCTWGQVLLHLAKRTNSWREQNKKTRFPYDFLFYNQTKCNIMPTIQCSPSPCGGLRPALAALPVSSQESPEQRAPGRALIRHGTGALEPQLRGHGSEQDALSQACPAAPVAQSAEGTWSFEWEHVMLHHFGGRPPHVKWCRHSCTTSGCHRSPTDYSALVTPAPSASSSEAKLEQLIARLFETIRMTNQW